MNMIDLLLFGAIVGGIANLVDPSSGKGFLGPVLLGSLGAIIGGILASLIFSSANITASNLIILALAILMTLTLVGLSKFIKLLKRDQYKFN